MKPIVEGRIITGGFALALAILLVVTGLSLHNTRRLTEAREWVGHSYIVIVKLERILTRLDDFETGSCGYILTGQEAYLEPFTAAITNLDQDFKKLKLLTADNPGRGKAAMDAVRAGIARTDAVNEKLLVTRVTKRTRRGQAKGGAAFPRADGGQDEYETRPIAV